MGICLHKQNRIESDKWAALGTIHFLATVIVIIAIVWLVPQARAATASSGQAMTVEGKYPGLATGVLKSAELKEMTTGFILKTKNLEIRQSQLQDKMAGAEPKIREQLEKNLFFLLEQEATMKILVYEARNSGLNTGGISDSEVVKSHLDRVSQQVSVSETEVKDFYKTHKEMVGGMPFEQVKDNIYAYLFSKKKPPSSTPILPAWVNATPSR